MLGIIWDKHRINQKCSSMFDIIDPEKPWIVKNPADETRPFFLLYDPVHLIKNMRNNWLTEKVGILEFIDIEEIRELDSVVLLMWRQLML